MNLFGFCLEKDEVVESLSMRCQHDGDQAEIWLTTNRYDRLIAKANSGQDLLIVLALLAKQNIADRQWVIKLWQSAATNLTSNAQAAKVMETELQAFVEAA